MKQQVLEFLLTIPKGKTTTYKALAEKFSTHPRAIAMFMKHNKEPQVYPCYKVVGAKGDLVGYSGEGGLKRKRELLEEEGIRFEGEKVSQTSILTKLKTSEK